jgi:hypothetical protein
MPDFAPNVTPRYVLKYHVAGRDHNIMMRTQRGTSFALTESYGQQLFGDLFDNLNSQMADDLAFVSAIVALTDDNLFFPAAVPTAVVGALALAGFSGQDRITHVTFAGRGSLGSKVNMHVYGVQLTPDVVPAAPESDFVLTAAESAFIAAPIAVLVANSHIRAIDNTTPGWYSRATIKPNDFWLKRLRNGS